MGLTHAAAQARPGARAAPPRTTSGLTIGMPHDAAEQEAERVSVQVLRGERVSVGTAASRPTLSRACEACKHRSLRVRPETS